MGIMQIPTILLSLCICSDFIACQNPSTTAKECFTPLKCPCCSVPCPSDGSGQCGGKCKDGYHGGKCLNRCPYNCLICVDAQQGGGVSNCTLCRDGYYSTETLYQCQSQCPVNCKTCNSNKNCTLCKEGYYSLATLKQCNSQCPVNCKTCNSNENCTLCKEGYYSPASLYQCQLNCSPNCKTCDFNATYCTGCVDGYYLDREDRSCRKCNSLCLFCNSSNTCTCSIGCYTQVNEQLTCAYGSNLCSFGCKSPNFSSQKCDKCTSSQHKETCDKCIDGNYGVQCDLKCNLNCKPGVCDRISGRCTNCIQGFYGNHCELQCPRNCNSCNKTSGFCDSCTRGFHGRNCTEMCPINCTDCLASTTCSMCSDGFYGDICEKTCPVNCQNKQCHKNNGTCVCIHGYSGILCDYYNVSTTEAVTHLERILPEDKSKHVGPTVGGTLAGTAIITAFVVVAVIINRRRYTYP